MVSYKKIFIVFLLITVFFSISVNFSFAQRELEVPIPGMAKKPLLPEYIVGIYNFALMIIGIVVFGALLYGGFRYLTSAGKPAAISDAKDQIFSAILGLIILFSSYIILTTINPELTIIGEPGKEIIGAMPEAEIIIYENLNYEGESYRIREDIDNLAGIGWGDKISSLKFPFKGIIIDAYKDPGYSGDVCRLSENADNIETTCGSGWNDQISSIKFIKREPFLTWAVNTEVYSHVHRAFWCPTDGGQSTLKGISPGWTRPETKVFVNTHEFPHGYSGGFGDARLWVNDAYVKINDFPTLETKIGCAVPNWWVLGAHIDFYKDYLFIKEIKTSNIETGSYLHTGFSCPTSGGGSQVKIDPKWASKETKVFVNVHEREHGQSATFGDARLWVNDAYVRGDDNTLRVRIGCAGFTGNISVNVDYLLIKE